MPWLTVAPSKILEEVWRQIARHVRITAILSLCWGMLVVCVFVSLRLEFDSGCLEAAAEDFHWCWNTMPPLCGYDHGGNHLETVHYPVMCSTQCWHVVLLK